MNTILFSVITCPFCKHKESETMSSNSCEYLYTCKRCDKLLKAKKGDCCVYCSYGTIPYPPIQEEQDCYENKYNEESK